jgi:hypothetical protein
MKQLQQMERRGRMYVEEGQGEERRRRRRDGERRGGDRGRDGERRIKGGEGGMGRGE